MTTPAPREARIVAVVAVVGIHQEITGKEEAKTIKVATLIHVLCVRCVANEGMLLSGAIIGLITVIKPKKAVWQQQQPCHTLLIQAGTCILELETILLDIILIILH